jgi:hypothetical protein
VKKLEIHSLSSIIHTTAKNKACLIGHDNTPHIPNPVNRIPSPTRIPMYAAVCTPIRGNTTGVYRIARMKCPRIISENTIQKVSFKEDINGLVYDGDWRDRDRGERRYNAEVSKVSPRERIIESMRCKHVTKTGIF